MENRPQHLENAANRDANQGTAIVSDQGWQGGHVLTDLSFRHWRTTASMRIRQILGLRRESFVSMAIMIPNQSQQTVSMTVRMILGQHQRGLKNV